MELIVGDDGLPVEEVGGQTKEKHQFLKSCLSLSGGARKQFIGEWKAGAACFDLFCGTGRCKIRGANEYIDGSAIAAWKCSCEGGFRIYQDLARTKSPLFTCAICICAIGGAVRIDRSVCLTGFSSSLK